jgi:hypothetical protein
MSKYLKTPIILLLLAASWWACQSDNKSTTAAPAVPNTPAAATGKPELYLYATQVTNLQLRDQPTTSGSNVLGKFPAGTVLEGTGEVSDKKETIELRGIPYNEPFFKVTTTTPDKLQGWAFGGAIAKIYAGPRAGAPDMTKVSGLAAFLGSLDPQQFNNGKKAWDYVSSNFADAKGSTAEAAYVLLERFLRRIEFESKAYEGFEKVNFTDEDYSAIYENRFDMNKYPITKQAQTNGFTVETTEGMVFPITDWARLYQFFASKVGPAFKAYLDQEQIEKRDPESSDGGLAITLEELVKRAAFWEKFNKDNPHFVLNDITIESEKWTAFALTNGMDNSPIYDYETETITPEFKAAWANIQQQYPGTKLAAKCKEFSDLCARYNWKKTPEVQAWMEKNAMNYSE